MSVRQQEASSNQEEVAKAIDALALHQSGAVCEPGDGGDSIAPSTLAKDVPPIKRTVLVSIRASMDDLVQESGAGRWAPSEGALKSIFQQRRFTSLDGSSEAQGDLSSVVLHKLELKHAKSTFPVSVGARITAVDDNTFSSTGDAYSHIVTPQTDRPYHRSLQEDPVDLAYSFASKFPGYTALNLETKGVHQVAAKRFVL